MKLTRFVTYLGTVVALQDIHQHMYVTVEGAQNNYSLVGAIHYSVVGERALFRVQSLLAHILKWFNVAIY